MCSKASFLYVKAVFSQLLFREEGSSVQPIVTHLDFVIYQTDFKTHLSTVKAKMLLVISTGSIGGQLSQEACTPLTGDQNESTLLYIYRGSVDLNGQLPLGTVRLRQVHARLQKQAA